MDLRIRLVDIFRYLDSNTFSRCVTEAEKLLLANHLITCGITSKTDEDIHIFGLCLQTSHLLSHPHTIKGIFFKNRDNLEIKQLCCTCKGGAGGQCKHSVAVLIHCNKLGL